MGAINWSELFPEKWSGVIFVSYMALFVNQGIIVTWSQSKGEYDYNIVAVVLVTEVLKLLVSACLYCWDNKISLLLHEIAKHKHVLLLYMVPSFLYCLYNNLAFVNLAVFDPTTYYLLLQFRVVITGIIFQVVFDKRLSTKQWLSLVLLTLGCMMKHLDLGLESPSFFSKFQLNINILFIFVQMGQDRLQGWADIVSVFSLERNSNGPILFLFCWLIRWSQYWPDRNIGQLMATSTWVIREKQFYPMKFAFVIQTCCCLLLILSTKNFKTYLSTQKRQKQTLQTICSCLAGVYNEYLLKGQGAKIDIFLQNVFMYIDSIVCNILVLGVQGNPSAAFENIASNILLRPKVMAIVVNNAAIGITTSLFLKKLNSILKTFASALELVFTAILCWLIFDIPIYLNTIVAIAMVSYAVILYSQNPVQNHNPKAKSSCTDEESMLST